MHGTAKNLFGKMKKNKEGKGDGYETHKSSTDSTVNTGPRLRSW